MKKNVYLIKLTINDNTNHLPVKKYSNTMGI